MYILPDVECTLCGKLWQRSQSLPPDCNHTDQEWSAYADAHPELPRDAIARWKLLDMQPIEPVTISPQLDSAAAKLLHGRRD